MTNSTLGILIFSKDRACQLHALLTSLRDHLKIPADIQVLYTSSTDIFRDGYELLKDIFSDPDVIAPKFVEQGVFREDVMRILRGFLGSGRRHLMFMVDDMVMVRPLAETKAIEQLDTDNSLYCVSTRLGSNITHCYALGADTPVPVITEGLWSWRGCSGDWAYPYSTDGQVYRTQEMYDMLFQHGFTCPNELERTMCIHSFERPKMFCFEHPKVVNVPANIVQTTYPSNRHAGTYTTENLNDSFLSGQKIDVCSIYAMRDTFNTCHVPLKYTIGQR